MVGPVVDEQPMHRVLVEPAAFCECRDKAVGASPPANEFGDPAVVEASDVALWGELSRRVPEQLQEAHRHRS